MAIVYTQCDSRSHTPGTGPAGQRGETICVADEASAASRQKTDDTRQVLGCQVRAAAHDVGAKTDLYDQPRTSIEEALRAAATFKRCVED